ncbi:MAG TPA: 2,3,4,5-tetrahydropyridine-2,6-dicarboxylate N-succinyltransferase [Gammaproteobacteria bacterium]|nr:2,3,4,5-tetrahydropyridine-2,6-dicarboxylate N-succinyltransferase [Gammaproteobacteria bacterium]
MTDTDLQQAIGAAFEQRSDLSPDRCSTDIRNAVDAVINRLDQGTLRVAEPTADGWICHEWVKKAVLLSFRIAPNQVMQQGNARYFDKVPLKYSDYDAAAFERDGARIVPPATVRRGAFVAPDAVLMPSYVNIGARIGAGTMIDTWATVGSCAQIGANVHIAGGVGIGGVLEPLQATPTIIEDDCFIGARSEVVEGVIVERGAVLSMGVYVGQSTRIYDRDSGEISYGRIPAGAVVVPGNLPASDGRYSLYAAIIVKRVDAKTRAKIGLNELLRSAARDE